MQCPICFEKLITQDCTPCDDCGCNHVEVSNFKLHKHSYKVYKIYNELHLTLCNFCDVDFSSYDPNYFGFKKDFKLNLKSFELIREIENPEISKDKFCKKCNHKIKFLNFIRDLRELNQNNAD